VDQVHRKAMRILGARSVPVEGGKVVVDMLNLLNYEGDGEGQGTKGVQPVSSPCTRRSTGLRHTGEVVPGSSQQRQTERPERT
jgi:hypothetical protein